MATINLQTATSRKRLAPRGKPYAITLLPGVHLGYRAAQSGTGRWIVIAAKGDGTRWSEAFAHADDQQDADGTKVLSYEQAALKARALARGDANAASDRPVTIAEAVDAYQVDLVGRGRLPYNAKWVRTHLPPHLAAQPLSLATAKQFRNWRDALLKAGILAATVNRMLKGAKAAFNLSAKLDKRVRANAGEWKVGLEALPGADSAREAVLNDAQVRAIVAAAYEESEAFGLYIQTHAETGARTSQLVRCTVRDLQSGRLMIPSSKKGRGRKATSTPVPLTANLEARLKAAAAGRADNAPLLLRADGKPWQPLIADHRLPFQRAVAATGLPDNTTPYSLRHSSVVRALLKNVPIKVVADWHDTSTAMIEQHYGRFIKLHFDEVVRGALLDTGPTATAKVVKLRA